MLQPLVTATARSETVLATRGSGFSGRSSRERWELSPANPSFLDERNAILSADQAVFSGSHHDAIGSVFAHRGMGFFAAAVNGNDSAPGQDFSLPPAPGSATGTLTGVVTQIDSGQPLAGATVVIASPLSGTTTTAVTGADGRYTLTGLPVGTYPKVIASAPGFDGVTTSVNVASGRRHATSRCAETGWRRPAVHR